MAGMISYRNECDENGIDMSISVNRIAFNAAKINYRDICSNRTVTFANNKAVVKKICLYLGPGLVEIEKDANGDTFITRKQGSPSMPPWSCSGLTRVVTALGEHLANDDQERYTEKR